MKKVEFILWAIVAVSRILWLIPMPGSSILFTLAMLALIVFYCVSSPAIFFAGSPRNMFRRDKYQNVSSKRILFATICGVVIAGGCLGILTKLINIPGGLFFLFFSILGVVILFIVALVKLIKSKNEFYKKAVTRLGIFITFFLFMEFWFPSVRLEKIRYRNDPQVIELINMYQEDPIDNRGHHLRREILEAEREADEEHIHRQ